MTLNAENDNSIAQFEFVKSQEFKKYLISSELDKKWGLTIQNVGHSKIPKNQDYPVMGHPSNYMFDWETGRVLEAYHVIFIVKGKGVFESESCESKEIHSNDAFLLFPNEWHRYKPDIEIGWEEYWIGFSGPIADLIMQNSFFRKQAPVLQKCGNALIYNLLETLVRLAEKEPFGYQRSASGILIQLMAELCNFQKKGTDINTIDSFVSDVKNLMNRNLDQSIEFQEYCEKSGISYSKFRSSFKQQTGFAPLQYFLLLKIEKAKDLLRTTDLSSKQIAFKLGFSSEHYFSRLFKSKTGHTSQEYKKLMENYINR